MKQTEKHAVEQGLQAPTKGRSRWTRSGGRLNIRKVTTLAALAVLSVTSALASPVKAAVEYSITNIGAAAGSNVRFSDAADINNNGRVAGTIFPYLDKPNTTSGGHPFYYDGTVHDFYALFNPPSNSADDAGYPSAINDSGLITGTFYSSTKTGPYAFLYSPSSNTAQDLSAAFPAGTERSSANDINNSGQIVGNFNGPNAGGAFLYSNGTVQNLSPAFPVGTTLSTANAINDKGTIVGYYNTPGGSHAYLYSGGVVQDLNPLLNTNYAIATAINNNNQVVGISYNDTGSHSFLYSGHIPQNLATSLPGTNIQSYARDINDRGQVVGQFLSSTFFSNHAFVYSNGVGQDLNDLIDPASGWVLENATAINDKGQITGSGTFNGQTGTAFVLTPIPTAPKVSGSGTFGSNKRGVFSFSFDVTGSLNSSDATGTFSFVRFGRQEILNAPVDTLVVNGDTATFSGVSQRNKQGKAPASFVVTLNQSTNTFTVMLYRGNSARPQATYSGALTSGSFTIS